MKTEKEINELIDTIKIPSDKEVEAAGLRFDRRLRGMRLRRRLIWGMSSVAAVGLIGIIFILFWQDDSKHEPVEVAKVIKIDSHVTVPTLILSNGNSVNLKEEKIEMKIQESNIRVEDNHITYDSVSNIQKVEYNTLVIPAGYTYNVTLADGTRVTLNAGSRLKYPVEFIGEKREVELSGEAYFDVTKSEKPFELSVSGSRIRVYGTQFNVKTSRENTVETVLVEGKIGFRAPGREEVKVVPGEQVSYNAASGNVDVRQVDTRYATAWMDGVFKYQDKKLNLVLEDISAWYGIEFESQTDITMIEVTMNLNKKTPIEEVISFIELMANCKFIKERGHYIVKK